jgi:hypothetical protein
MSVREILSRNYKDAINLEIWFATLLYIFVAAVIDYDFATIQAAHVYNIRISYTSVSKST